MGSFVRDGGTGSGKGLTAASISVTVPAAGHAVGNLVHVGAGLNCSGGAGVTFTCADSKGNTYSLLEVASDGGNIRSLQFGSLLETALVSGDTITVTPSSGTISGYAMRATEFAGFGVTEDVASTSAGAASATVAVGPITPPSAATLVLAQTYIQGLAADAWTGDLDTDGGAWVERPVIGTTGGTGSSNRTNRFAYKITTSSVAQTFNSTIFSRNWRSSLVSVKEAVVVLSATVNQSSETDTAQILASTKQASVGQASKTAVAQQVGSRKSVVLGQATETGTALTPVTSAIQASEFNTANPVSSKKFSGLVQAEAQNTAHPLASVRSVGIGQASEVAAAQVIATTKKSLVGQSSETSTAQIVTPSLFVPGQFVGVGMATETSSSNTTLTSRKTAIGQPQTLDTSLSMGVRRTYPVLQASSVDAAQTILAKRSYLIGSALSDGLAGVVSPKKTTAVTPAEETSTATSVVAGPKSVLLSLLTESDTAFSAATIKAQVVSLAAEMSSATQVVSIKYLNTASELDLATQVEVSLPIQIIPALVGFPSRTGSPRAGSTGYPRAGRSGHPRRRRSR